MSTSINLTIHNKDFLLQEVLRRISTLTTGAYQLVCVLDGCTDDSQKVLEASCREFHLQPRVLVADNVFETRANNLAAKASDGDFIIIVQDDCLLDEFGWNERLLKPFAVFSDVFAVTGRTAHNWNINPLAVDSLDSPLRCDRWCDLLVAIDCADHTYPDRNLFAVRDTVNRSPLALQHADLAALDYFDEAFSPQDCDDHDLMYRMQKQIGKVCGMVPLAWWSKNEWGGTRVNGRPAAWLLAAHHKNMRLLYQRHASILMRHAKENRRFL